MPFTPANPYSNFFSGQGKRAYNVMPDPKQASFGYAFNPFYDSNNGISGQFQPLTTNNQGALRVDIGTGVTIAATITGTTVTVDDIAVTGGQINVIGFSTLTGQVAQLQTAVNALTGTLTSKWQKTKTPGYAEVYGAVTGACLINKVQGYSQTATVPGFIQLFDKASIPTVGEVPDFVVATQPNNYYLQLAEAGVEFINGLQIVNSTVADTYQPVGAANFVANIVYKRG